jgi:hypothetical protein
MDCRFETPQRDLIRVTHGDLVRFIPVDPGNADYRQLIEGRPGDPEAGIEAIPPAMVIDHFTE